MWSKNLNDVGSVISRSIPNSFFFRLSLYLPFFSCPYFMALAIPPPPGSWPSLSSVPKAHNDISASRLAQVDSPLFSQASILFYFFFPSPPLMIHGGPLKRSRRAPGLIQAFPRSPEEPTTIFLPLPLPFPGAQWFFQEVLRGVSVAWCAKGSHTGDIYYFIYIFFWLCRAERPLIFNRGEGWFTRRPCEPLNP